GAAGFGRRSGLLEAPSRVAQASAPVLFGLCLDRYGAQALWLSGGIAFCGLLGVLYLGFGSRRMASY
ncbi:UNVERIFIED_CONTAM: MFS transporter, partial [Salmonella enterica subsp. enterica serovar Weltevreden]